MSTKSSKKSKAPQKNQFSNFVNFYLTKTDKDAISTWLEKNPEGVGEFISESIEDGYAFKIAYDYDSECVMVMMIGERTLEVNKGKIMSARHASLPKAIAVLAYQHRYLSVDGVWEEEDMLFDNNNW